MFTNFNCYTIIGIICGLLTYYFIQKGAIVNATKIKNELKSEIDTVQKKAIQAINTTTDSTIKKISQSSNTVINDIENKTRSIRSSLTSLDVQTKLRSKKTQELINSGVKDLMNPIPSVFKYSIQFLIPAPEEIILGCQDLKTYGDMITFLKIGILKTKEVSG